MDVHIMDICLAFLSQMAPPDSRPVPTYLWVQPWIQNQFMEKVFATYIKEKKFYMPRFWLRQRLKKLELFGSVNLRAGWKILNWCLCIFPISAAAAGQAVAPSPKIKISAERWEHRIIFYESISNWRLLYSILWHQFTVSTSFSSSRSRSSTFFPYLLSLLL